MYLYIVLMPLPGPGLCITIIYTCTCTHVQAAHLVPSFEWRLAPLEQEASDVPQPPLLPYTTLTIHTLTIDTITIHTLTIVIEKLPQARKVLFDWRWSGIPPWTLEGQR